MSETIAPTLDEAVGDLRDNADSWARLDVPSRLAALSDVRKRLVAGMDEWVRTANEAKGVSDLHPASGEEWLAGPYGIITWLDAMHASLSRIWRGRTTYRADHVRIGPGGRTVVDVMPYGWRDRLLLSGFSAEVWMQPEVTAADLPATTATFYSTENPPGTVCAVLGAGNVASIAPLDTLYQLFVRGAVVILKMNPVNEYLRPHLSGMFGGLIERGFVRIATGGADVGAALVAHPGVDEIHITGSERTHDAIVFGTGEEAATRKSKAAPLLQKPISSELGGVSPVIIVPGPWSRADLKFQAAHVATQKLHNGGFNCVASQVMVVADGWEHTERFIGLVEEQIASTPVRPAYYPGAGDRQEAALRDHADAVDLGGVPPRVHLRDIGSDSTVCTREFFGAVLATHHVPTGDPETFLSTAVRFANDSLRGTLGANIIVHPSTVEELGDRFDEALVALRYGTIGINVWTGFGYLQPRATWGAYPGHPLEDIESGRGIVHNALMFDKPEKTVVRGPFRPVTRVLGSGEFHASPRPPWFVQNRTGHRTAEELTRLVADGSPRRLPRVVGLAMSG